MDQNKFDEIWQLLKKYNFEFDTARNDKIICSICKNIMVNACKGPCDCRYCLECIKKQIEDYKYCPGQSEKCKSVEINWDFDIIIDELTNITIANIIVKCPISDCIFEDKLKEIINHMRLCGLSIVSCPYLNMGCKQPHVTNENMKQHLLMEIISHTKMLMEFNNNLKNDLELLKKNYEKLNDENENLKRKLIIQENSTGNLTGNLTENNLLIRTLFENIDSLKSQLGNLINDKETKEKEQEREICELKQKLNEAHTMQAEAQSKFNETVNNKLDPIESKLINMKIDLFELGVNTNNMDIIGELVWKIEKFSQLKRNKWNYSKSFYSHKHGYKFCVGVWLDGHLLNVGLCLMRGEHDDRLEWPFNRAVIIELINQLTETPYKKKKLQYSQDSGNIGWTKPLNERNDTIGCYNFLKINELVNNSEICRNDLIIIKCITSV